MKLTLVENSRDREFLLTSDSYSFQKRTHGCYYLLLPGFLLKQWEIGHEKYVFFFLFLSIFLAKNTLSPEKNATVLIFAVARVPFETVGNWPFKICISSFCFFSFFLAKNTFSTEKNARVLLFGTVAWVPFETAGNLPCKICFFLLVLFSEKNA